MDNFTSTFGNSVAEAAPVERAAFIRRTYTLLAVAILAMPQNALLAAKVGWRSADAMWRLAGDTATDYNHYSKRAILAGIYAASLGVYVNDESEGKADAAAFLDRRIDGVMKFEKAKAQLLTGREHFDLARFLGRLRYSQA